MTENLDDYRQFFRRATQRDGSGHDPYPFQLRLAEESWPDVIDVPTGMGKTAAVGLAWLYKRHQHDPATPRRLIYCLPMRVLVEQTAENFRTWLANLDLLGLPGAGKVSVNVLMGGEEDARLAPWAENPEEDAVLVGTQDMLLSRALMRGYGMSRFQWPVHYALLHTDALWVYDEVQLMGPAVRTSAQLEAFRRSTPNPKESRTLWLSATLRTEWLETVDFRPHAPSLVVCQLEVDDRERAASRLSAVKRLAPASARLSDSAAGARAEYTDSLAREILSHHRLALQTLVIVNRVGRAQALYRAIQAQEPEIPTLLLHSRFRSRDRKRIEGALHEKPGKLGRIVVATQAVEAGIDITSAVLFTELAPWSSMVQRFGRCNRYGEHAKGADVFWIDIARDIGEALPYDEDSLGEARNILTNLRSAASANLQPVPSGKKVEQVLRRKDFLDLFDTDPDLSGFDVDVSPYIRDPGSPQVQLFWRDFDNDPTPEEKAPRREELCSASLGQFSEYLKKKVKGKGRQAWIWDTLIGKWTRFEGKSPRPGLTLLLRAEDGGYFEELGFDPAGRKPVALITTPPGGEHPERRDPSASAVNERYDEDASTTIGRPLSLATHVADVVHEVEKICADLNLRGHETRILRTAALWHDVGKAHPAFQTALRDTLTDESPPDGLLAKSGHRGRLNYRIVTGEKEEKRRFFRHELASFLAWIEKGTAEEHRNLIAYLILAHHGRVRMNLRALPTEVRPPDRRRFARGVWDGDVLPHMEFDGLDLPETELHLDLMEIGLGAQGPSWTERVQRLLRTEGPFRLAWMEALLRIADWRASRIEAETQ